MTTKVLEERLYSLLGEMEADPAGRYVHRPAFHALLSEMEAAGMAVPERLYDLDQQLIEEGEEANFDNMPV